MREMFFLAFFYRNADPAEGGAGYDGGRNVLSIRNWPSDVALMGFFFRCRQELLGPPLLASCVRSQAVGRIGNEAGHVAAAFRQCWHFKSFVSAENSGYWNFRGADSLPVASDSIPHSPVEAGPDGTRRSVLAYLTVVLPRCTREIRIVDHEPLL